MMRIIPKGTKVVLYVPYLKAGMGECTITDIPMGLDIREEDGKITFPIKEIREYLGTNNGHDCIALYFDKNNNYLHMKDLSDVEDTFCMWINKKSMI